MSYIPVPLYVTSDPRILALHPSLRLAAIMMLSDAISFYYGGIKNKKKPGVLRKGQKTMMQDYGLKHRTHVRDAMKALEAMGAIKILQEGKPGNGQTYHVMYLVKWSTYDHLNGRPTTMILHNNIESDVVITPSNSTEINCSLEEEYELVKEYCNEKNINLIPLETFKENRVKILNKINHG